MCFGHNTWHTNNHSVLSIVTANTQFDEGANKIDTITGTTLDENKKQQRKVRT